MRHHYADRFSMLGASALVLATSAMANAHAAPADEEPRVNEVHVMQPGANLLRDAQPYLIHKDMVAAYPTYAQYLHALDVDVDRPAKATSFVFGNAKPSRIDAVTYEVGECAKLPATWRHDLMASFNTSGTPAVAASTASQPTEPVTRRAPNFVTVDTVPAAPKSLDKILVVTPVPDRVIFNATGRGAAMPANIIVLKCQKPTRTP